MFIELLEFFFLTSPTPSLTHYWKQGFYLSCLPTEPLINAQNCIWHTVRRWCARMLSPFRCIHLFVTQWTITCQVPLSMGFSRQEYWSRLPCPPSGDLPDPGIKHTFLECPPLQMDSLPLSHQPMYGLPTSPNSHINKNNFQYSHKTHNSQNTNLSNGSQMYNNPFYMRS